MEWEGLCLRGPQRSIMGSVQPHLLSTLMAAADCYGPGKEYNFLILQGRRTRFLSPRLTKAVQQLHSAENMHSMEWPICMCKKFQWMVNNCGGLAEVRLRQHPAESRLVPCNKE